MLFRFKHVIFGLVDELDDDHPLFCVDEQVKGLLEGLGAGEDHQDVIDFLRSTGLPEGTVRRIHRAIVCAEVKDGIFGRVEG